MQQLADVLAKPAFRKAAANFGWLSIERVGRLALGLLVGLLVVRYLGPARWGALSYCVALVTLIGFLSSLGLDAVVKRELLRTPERTAELLASSFVLRLFAGGLAYGVLGLTVLAWPPASTEEARSLWSIGLILFQPALFVPELWLQAHLRAKLAAGVQLGALAVAAIARVVCVQAGAALEVFAWIIVVEMLLSAAGFLLWTRGRESRFALRDARRGTMKRLLGEAWPLMFAGLAVVVYMKIDEVMLRHLAGATEVGLYAAAVKLSELWYFVPVAMGSSLLPALLRAREADASQYRIRLQQYYDLSAAVAYVLSIPIALVAPWIVRLAYGPQFAPAGPILAVHIWSSIFVFLGVARGQWLVNEGLQKFYLAAAMAGAVANVALNLIFIPRWGGLGAAYATVVSYALAAWLASYFHPQVRETAVMQTRALLIPLRGWRYLART